MDLLLQIVVCSLIGIGVGSNLAHARHGDEAVRAASWRMVIIYLVVFVLYTGGRLYLKCL